MDLTTGMRRRAVTPGDEPFLFELFCGTREAELAMVPWTSEQKHAFLTQQFQAQDRHYRANYPTARFQLIEVNGERAGRLSVAQTADAVEIIDLIVASDFRGRGLGTALLQECLAEARSAGLPARLHVEQGNRARELYERLGFRPLGWNGFHLRMEHPGR